MQALLFILVLPLLVNIGWIAQGPLAATPPQSPVQPAPQKVLGSALRPQPDHFAAQSAPATPHITPPVAVAPEPTPEQFVQEVEQLVWQKTNEERKANKLSALKVDAKLAVIARAHSKDMFEKKYFEHEDLEGCNSACRAKDAGYAYYALGENIFLTSGLNLTAPDAAATIVLGWMGSPGHRANILQKAYKNTGIGVFAKDNKIYTTAMYSQPR